MKTALLTEFFDDEISKEFDDQIEINWSVKGCQLVFFLYDMHLRKFLYLGERVKSILGYPLRKLLEMEQYSSLIHPGDLETVKTAYQKLYQEAVLQNYNLQSTVSEFRMKNAEDKWVWLELTAIIISRSKRLFGIIKDISQRKSHEQLYYDQLAHSEKPLKQHSEFSRKISAREQEVLYYIADGFSAKMIADKLHISTHTAINHRKNLITKFEVKNTAELIKKASRYFWL